MADNKTTSDVKQITFTCKFCGQPKPLADMTLITRYYPIMVSCRECDLALQSLKPAEEAADAFETEPTP